MPRYYYGQAKMNVPPMLLGHLKEWDCNSSWESNDPMKIRHLKSIRGLEYLNTYLKSNPNKSILDIHLVLQLGAYLIRR